MKKVVAVVVVGFVASIAMATKAAAGPILLTDTIGSAWDPIAYLQNGQSETITHTLDPAIPSGYEAYTAIVKLSFSDGLFHQDAWKEFAYVSGDGITGQWVDIGGTHFNLDVHFFLVGGAGLDKLTAESTLDVTVIASNTKWNHDDFWWKSSKLIVKAIPTPVPEPGTLALLGAGLLGAGLMRRRWRIESSHSPVWRRKLKS